MQQNYHPALWCRSASGHWFPTESYYELLVLYSRREISRGKFFGQLKVIMDIYDGEQAEPF